MTHPFLLFFNCSKSKAVELKRKRKDEEDDDNEDDSKSDGDDDSNDDDSDDEKDDDSDDEPPKKSSRVVAQKKIPPKKAVPIAKVAKKAKKAKETKKPKVMKKRKGKNSDDDDDSDDEKDSNMDDDDREDDEEEEVEDDDEASHKSSRTAAKKVDTGRKSKVEKRNTDKKNTKKTTESSLLSSDKLPKAKKMRKVERLEEARKSFKWWEAPELPDGLNWRKLEHAGISFAPPYVKHGVPMKYDGNILLLTEKQEEMASFYAALPDDGPQLGIPKTRVVFQKNFFVDFKETFPPGSVVKKFDKCDFTAIKDYLDLQKSLRKAATDEEKLVKKLDKEVVVLQYGYCLIDGRMERVRNQQASSVHLPLYSILTLQHFP